MLLAGTKKGLFIVNGRKVTAPHFLGDPVSAVLKNKNHVFAALNLGHFGVKLHRSSNGGKTWTEIAVPAFPPQPADAKGPPWKLVQIWTLAAGTAPGELWAGTIPGGLFRSTDNGDSWSLVESLWQRPERLEWMGGGYEHPGIHSICIHQKTITVGISSGGVWQSRDAGKSWNIAGRGMYAEYMPPEKRDDPNIQDPHCVVQCAAQPEVLWAQHHNGIFRSTDYSASWKEITNVKPSKFGFAVAVHPKDPDTAWFVPAIKDERRVPVDGRFVVSRTRDGGKTFQALGKGLPPRPAYDLVYRHGLAVDDSGKRLAMGSTTGGLWLSENGGATWKCLSPHLPPAPCGRFG